MSRSAKSCGLVSALAKDKILALSAADIPVVTPPPLKSTETVNAHGISIITDHDVIPFFTAAFS
jgi:hypothetical protein